MFRPKIYSDYPQFFTVEIETKDYQDVVSKYIFRDNQQANIIFNQMFAEYLHPLIHLGFGLEFKQPAIVAEALGSTAIHPTFLDSFFIETHEAATMRASEPDHLANIMNKIRADIKLFTAAHWDDGHKVRDGILVRAKEEMIKYASQRQVKADNVEEATAEMINACGSHNVMSEAGGGFADATIAYMTGAAQHAPKVINFE
ncbi:MAG: hypothetical protein Q9195_007721 [Heterodermia aff. obscurata]